MEIADGLKKNRTIYGFHFLGNFGYVDSKGFLKFDDSNTENVSSENGHIKIQSFDIVHRRPKIKMGLEKLKDVCWICEGWSSQDIFHHLDTVEKFAEIYLNYEGFQPKTLSVENGWIKLHEMFPPQETTFYLTNTTTLG